MYWRFDCNEQGYLAWQLHVDSVAGLIDALFVDPRLVQGDAQTWRRYCLRGEVCDHECERIGVHASASGNLKIHQGQSAHESTTSPTCARFWGASKRAAPGTV